MFQKSGGDRGLSHEHLKAHRVWGEMNVVAVVSMADTRGVRWQLGLPSRGSDEAWFFLFFFSPFFWFMMMHFCCQSWNILAIYRSISSPRMEGDGEKWKDILSIFVQTEM